MVVTESDFLNALQHTDSRDLVETIGNFMGEGLLMLDLNKHKLVKDRMLYVIFVI